MRNLCILIPAIIVFVILMSGCSQSETKPAKLPALHIPFSLRKVLIKLGSREKARKLDAYFRQMYNEKLFSGNVLVAQHGVVIFRGCYGYANYSTRDTLTPDCLFQIGSISKQFTGFAIVKLIEQGKIDTLSTVDRYIPGFPYPNVTILQLLIHQSGLPNYNYFCDALVTDQTKTLKNADVIGIMMSQPPARYFAPGTDYNYNNTNYFLLSHLVEKIEGIPFEKWVHENIFQPAGMTNAIFYSDTDSCSVLPKIATGYITPKREAGFYYMNQITGDKGIFATVDDLYHWDQALYNEDFISEKWRMIAFQPRCTTRYKNIYYGFGWKNYYLQDSTRVIFHSGWWQGYQGVLIRIEKDSTTVVALKNIKNRHPLNQRLVFDILYPGKEYEPSADQEAW